MSPTSPSSTSNIEEAFARTLERQEKVDDWFYGILIIGCFLLMIIVSIFLLL